MITAEEFKKLIALELEDCDIFLDDEQVHGLCCEEEDEFVDGCEQMNCTFTFVDDRYTTVHSVNEFPDAEWTVKKYTIINWRG